MKNYWDRLSHIHQYIEDAKLTIDNDNPFLEQGVVFVPKQNCILLYKGRKIKDFDVKNGLVYVYDLNSTVVFDGYKFDNDEVDSEVIDNIQIYQQL